MTAPDVGASSPNDAGLQQQQQQQQQHQHQMPGLRPLHHHHSYSDSDLQELKHQAAHLQDTPELIRLDSDDGEQPGWATNWAAFDDPAAAAAAAAAGTAAPSAAAAADDDVDGTSLPPQAASSLSGGTAQAAASGAAAIAAAAAAAAGSGGGASAPDLQFEAPTSSSVLSTGEEVPDHDHTHERRELIIYAIPLTRGKASVCYLQPWLLTSAQGQRLATQSGWDTRYHCRKTHRHTFKRSHYCNRGHVDTAPVSGSTPLC